MCDTLDLDEFDAVVYDLDGTLVRLVVDWDQVAREAIDVFRESGVDADGMNLWELLELADEHDLRDDIEAVIAAHECEGARRSERLWAADCLEDRMRPIGVCSLNAEQACRLALETHGLDDAISTVVGRDSVSTRKPHPEPLLTVIDRLGVDADRAVFVGDTERDAATAERAGVAFRYVDGEPVRY